MATNNNVHEKAARRKLTLLELAEEMGNVSQACKKIGYSRQQFYEIRRNYQTYGFQGLMDKLPGCKTGHPNRVSDEVEQAILDYSLMNPSHGELRVSQQLMLQGIQVSSGGVRGVFARHKLSEKYQRLLRLDKHYREQNIELTDNQIKALEKYDPEYRERHIEVNYTGHIVSMDTFFVGSLKGIGRIYLQTVIDCYSRYAFGNLFTSKLPLTSVQTLNNTVLPFFESQGVTIESVLTDNGREYCGRPDQHPFELFLQLEGVEHRKTRVRRPQSNGFVERLHRTLLDEHFSIKGREKFYESVEEMQKDLDKYLVFYNTKRTHQGRNMNGMTPEKAFHAGKPKQEEGGTAA